MAPWWVVPLFSRSTSESSSRWNVSKKPFRLNRAQQSKPQGQGRLTYVYPGWNSDIYERVLTACLETYLIFVALQCLAIPLALFLTPPEKVQRSDGSKVKVVLQDSWRAEMWELWNVCRRKEVSRS